MQYHALLMIMLPKIRTDSISNMFSEVNVIFPTRFQMFLKDRSLFPGIRTSG